MGISTLFIVLRMYWPYNISQNVVLIGLDHNYQDITQGIIEQGITTSPIHIGEHTIIAVSYTHLDVYKRQGIISGYNVDATDTRNATVHMSNLMNIITTERTLKILWQKHRQS